MATRFETLHDEVLRSLEGLAPSPEVGERIRVDRGSELRHLGVRTPARRKLVAGGFSFTDAEGKTVLADWDKLWRSTDVADVLFLPLDYYRTRVPKEIPQGFWGVTESWIDRIDNWAHADDLARIYSWVLADDPAGVYPTLQAWNESSELWRRRISIVSLVHYSGKNAFFMPIDAVLPLLEVAVDDARPMIQKAIGWVLREASALHPDAVAAFVDEHGDALSSAARRRATERLGD